MELNAPLAPHAGSMEDLASARRHGGGHDRYGPFNPATDTRSMPREIQEELADAWNYCGFHALQARRGRAARWLLRIALRVAWWAVACLSADPRR